jgi:hypothetical protein
MHPFVSFIPPFLLCVYQNGDTALIIASFKGHTEFVELLLEAKAHTDIISAVRPRDVEARGFNKAGLTESARFRRLFAVWPFNLIHLVRFLL